MKTKTILLTIIFAVLSFIAFGQDKTIDVLYLKNGSIIRGSVIEFITNKTIKIQTADGSIYVYRSEECDSIKKEVSKNISTIPIDGFMKYDNDITEAAKIKMNTVPEKFSKKCYYSGIIEFDNYLGQSDFDETYYVKNYKLIAYRGIHMVNGIQFFKNFYLSVGTGINFHLYDDIIDYNSSFKVSFPVYLDFRWYIGSDKVQPYLNASGGVLLPFCYIANDGGRCHYFLNPAIGIKASVSGGNSLNISLGYSIMYSKYVLVTEGYWYNYYHPIYPYMEHEVYNKIKGINLKIAFTF